MRKEKKTHKNAPIPQVVVVPLHTPAPNPSVVPPVAPVADTSLGEIEVLLPLGPARGGIGHEMPSGGIS